MILNTVGYSEMLKPRPKPVYLIDKIIIERTVNIFYGFPGSKKSLEVADMAMAIATGSNFLPSMPGSKLVFPGYKTKKAAVLWLDYENGEDLSYERFSAFGKTYQADPNINLYYSCLPVLSPHDPKQITALINEIKAFPTRPEVIVIDTLLRFAKVKDENSSEMDEIMAVARKLVNELQVTIILISHSTKTTSSRAGNALRGHSSIEGGADSVFRVNSDRNTDKLDVINEKARRNPIEPFSAKWTYTSDPATDQLIEARLYYEPYVEKQNLGDQKRQAYQTQIEKDILAVLDSNGRMSKSEIARAMGKSKTTIQDAI